MDPYQFFFGYGILIILPSGRNPEDGSNSRAILYDGANRRATRQCKHTGYTRVQSDGLHDGANSWATHDGANCWATRLFKKPGYTTVQTVGIQDGANNMTVCLMIFLYVSSK